MRFFKTHLGLILPLLFMMLAFEFILIINQTIKHYEEILNKDYNIIVASSAELKFTTLKIQLDSLASIDKIEVQSLVQRLKNDISATNLATLQKSLPNFYSLKLENLPSQADLSEIKDKLSKLPGILRVETFAKTYDKVYILLSLIKFVLWFFLFIIILLSFVLFFKQMKIWLFEHRQRIEIMCLFGAPFWFRSLMLYKIVFTDCLVAYAILLVFFTQIYGLNSIKSALNRVDIILPDINFFLHLSIVFLFTLCISLLCVNSVMFKVKR